jgi:hypothetical protein
VPTDHFFDVTLHEPGNVPETVCLPADCMAVDSSDDESVCLDDSNREHPYTFDLKSINVENNTSPSFNKDIKIIYDDDSYLFSDGTATTAAVTFSDNSVGNASIESFDTMECYQGEADQPLFNYKGPKVMPTRHETPVTICTANTIGTLRSRRIFRVLLDSGSSCSLIKRSCLPKGCKTKTLEKQKKVSTLAGKMQTQEMVTMRDIRLPEFDKNRRIDQNIKTSASFLTMTIATTISS